MKKTLENLMERRWFPFAALALAALLVYGRTLFFGFTWLDDDGLILNNLPFLSKLSSLPAAFAREAFGGAGLGSYYRPLLTVSLILDTVLGGEAPYFYHLSSLALHTLACMAVYVFLRAWGHGSRFALGASLLFSVHPLLNQAVAWIPGRNDVLLALFASLSFAYFIKALSGQRRAFAAHLFLYACALFSKESAVVLPVLLSAYLLFVRRRRPEGSLTCVKLAAGWAAVTAGWLIARSLALGLLFSGPKYAGGLSFFSNFPALVSYYGKAFFPYNLSSVPVLPDLSLVPGLIALALTAALVLRGGGRAGVKLFGAAWFFVWLLPSLVRSTDGFAPEFGEHRVYTSMIGLLLLAGELRPRPAAIKATLAGAAAAFLLLAAVSAARLGSFSGRIVFWESAVAGSPSSLNNRSELGAAYYDAGRYPGAAAQWLKALEIAPDNAMLNVNMGSIAYIYGLPGKAAVFWEKALVKDPGNLKVLNNMAVMWFDKKDYRKAAVCVDRLLALGARVHPQLLSATARYRKAT